MRSYGVTVVLAPELRRVYVLLVTVIGSQRRSAQQQPVRGKRTRSGCGTPGDGRCVRMRNATGSECGCRECGGGAVAIEGEVSSECRVPIGK